MSIPRASHTLCFVGQLVFCACLAFGQPFPCPTSPIAFGQTINGTLGGGDCVIDSGSGRYGDLYAFTANAGQQVAVELSGNNLDTFLYLYGPGNQVLAVNDDILQNNCNSINCTVVISDSRLPGIGFLTLTVSGTYTVVASSYSAVSGSYSLRLLTPDSTGCNYKLTPFFQNFSPSGGSGTVNVNVANGCGWQYVRADTWISASASGSSGPGTVFYTVDRYTGPVPRSTVLVVANQRFTIIQDAACSFSLSASSSTVPLAGATGTVGVTTSAGCAWTATTNVGWITFASGGSGTGTGTLTYTVAPSPGGASRVATILIGGQSFTVTQVGAPSLVSLNPFQGTGLNATLTFVYSHPSGWAAIQSAEFILNPRWEASLRGGGCYIKYTPATGLFTLIANDGNSIAGTAVPGSAATVSNSQCTLNAANSSASGAGNTLTLVASLSFRPTFSGQRHIWMQAVDTNNSSTNWLVYGVWNPTQSSVNAGPWYRIFDPFSNSYLYSFDKNEYDTLGARGFVLQGTSGLVMDGSATVGGISNMAWYRVFVNATNSHFWTSDRNEFLTLINAQQAYVGEGVAAFVMPYLNALGQISPQVSNTVPFYRAAFSGKNLHFWTPDRDEYLGANGKHLPTGYFGEGIACYIFPAGGAQGIAGSAAAGDDGWPAVVSVANGASFAANGVVAPGQVLSVYGRHLGGKVLLNGAPAEVVSMQDNEIRLVVPSNLAADGEVILTVEHRGRRTEAVKLTAVRANPAIFGNNQYGRGNAQARNEDGTINGIQNPAVRGSLVTLDTTGFASLDLPLEVHIGGQPATIVSTQLSATQPGVIEVQIQVPGTIDPAPFQPVVLHVGNAFSQPGIGLAIR
jgi:uncharacterized protein (TIGR03437 family)